MTPKQARTKEHQLYVPDSIPLFRSYAETNCCCSQIKKTLRQRVEGRRGKNGMPKMAFYFVAASKTLMRIWVKAPPGADPGCSSGYSNSEQIVGAIVQCGLIVVVIPEREKKM